VQAAAVSLLFHQQFPGQTGVGKSPVSAHQPHPYRLLGNSVPGDPTVDVFSAADTLCPMDRGGQLGASGSAGDFYRMVSEVVSGLLCGQRDV
jgi:hypothetical protein